MTGTTWRATKTMRTQKGSTVDGRHAAVAAALGAFDPRLCNLFGMGGVYPRSAVVSMRRGAPVKFRIR